MQDILGKTYEEDADYYDAANLVVGNDITAFVEGLDDETFWGDVFSKFAPSLKIKFEAHSRNHEYKTGKLAVLKRQNETNQNLILCVDSDFDYLLKDKDINENPYIFQTYTYAIENYKCAPKSLSRLVKTVTLEKPDFDFVKFFAQYSRIIFPFFLLSLYFEQYKRVQNQAVLKETDLTVAFCLKNEKVNLDDPQAILQEVEKNVTTLTNQLKVRLVIDLLQQVKILKEGGEIKGPSPDYEISSDFITQMVVTLKNEFHVEETEVFWYINGHKLYDCVVKFLLHRLIPKVKQARKSRYKSDLHLGDQVKSKSEEYQNYTREIHWQTLLKVNHRECLISEETCPLMTKIKEDILAFCKKRGEINGNDVGRWN